MSLHQFSAEWNTAEDRIRLRISTRDGQEFRFWLTRHIVAGFLSGAQSLGIELLARQHPQEVAQAMHEFRQQASAQQSDFSQAFMPGDHLPLGEETVLVTGFTLHQSLDHVEVEFKTASGHQVSVRINDTILRGWVELLDKLQAMARWNLQAAPDIGVIGPADTPPLGRVMH
ncbi:hypothetical protein [Leptothrix discophora]|uniref:Uncharacterized protein n=1 Tax=Leptothrix discophora TaxID=89 RepID=A0ABT9G205_LEPDI|nr:hypothetical protein [Leptothrix discophora]MDP4300501.1 hypothetical protein [Leptothrix discophora]